MGVTQAGEKKLLAVHAGYRESKSSWEEVFTDLKKRGFQMPLAIIADGALGLWACVKEMELFKETKEIRCWVHKIANVLDKFPKRTQPRVKGLLHDMMNAESELDAEVVKDKFIEEFEEKFPKAVTCLTKDWSSLVAHFSFPAMHWQHIRTTNPIESMFATVKLRTRVTKGAGSLKMAEVMAFKMMIEAEKNWRRIKGADKVAGLLKGDLYKDGILIELKNNQKVAA